MNFTDRFVGLGDVAFSSDPKDVIKTFALASCVGITAFCVLPHIAGMIHIVLPDEPEFSISAKNPCYYAATGVPLFIKRLEAHGCTLQNTVFNVYGGASSARKNDFFNIGARNLAAVEDSLRQLRVPYQLTDIGGCVSRSLYLDVGTGAVEVNRQPIVI